jgi:ABC-2 type transport system ATP-binding protein
MDSINITNLKKIYNKVTVTDIPSLTIYPGEIVGIIGNNGAGKTTLLRLMLDLIKANAGSVYSQGTDVSKDEKWKTYTSSYLDTNFLIHFLTPEEYFAFIAKCYGKDTVTCQEGIDRFHAFMNNEILNQKKYIRDFSSGNKQKIGIIGAVLPEPELLILDEPFNYLDPTSQFFIRDYLSALNKEKGTTMIISSHNLEGIYDIATRLIVLEKGKIIKDYNTVNTNTKEELNDYFRLNM